MSAKLTNNEGKVATVDAFAAMVANVMKDMNIRLARLKDPGKKRTPNGFPEAMARVLNEVETADAGPAQWSAKSVSKHYKSWQADGSLFPAIERSLSGECSEQSESEQTPGREDLHTVHSEQDESENIALSDEDLPLDFSECSEPSEQPELSGIPEPMKTAFRAMAKEVFEEMLATAPNVQRVRREMSDDLPPEPEELQDSGKGGRRQTRTYEKLSATVDTELFKRFRAERKERGLSAGRLLDAILWHWYHKPELSYQQPDAVERARDRPKRTRKSNEE